MPETGHTNIKTDDRPVDDVFPVLERRGAVPWSDIVRMLDETPVDGDYARDSQIA